MARPRLNLTGRTFHRWRVVRISRPRLDKHGKPQGVYWLCRCECGAEREVVTAALTRGKSKSCGCLVEQCGTKHGLHGTPEYRVWKAVKARCYIKSASSYKNYGGRGIVMCDEWKNSAEAMIRDMGPRPSPKHSIERKDNNGPYCKDNCRWATKSEQGNNTRRNVRRTYMGRTQTLVQWAREFGINFATLRSRVVAGWPMKVALTKPPRRSRTKK